MTKISFMRFSWLLGSPTRLTWVCLLSLSLTIAASGQLPTPVVDSPRIPRDVSIPGGFNGNPIAFFDHYSWRTFIAVVWPALTGQRGQPDPNQMVDGARPRVFETYKTLEEV